MARREISVVDSKGLENGTDQRQPGGGEMHPAGEIRQLCDGVEEIDST